MGLVKLDQTDNAPATATGIESGEVATAQKDTFTNRTAISPSTYPKEYGSLLTYSTGTPVNVEYFKQRVPLINKQSIDTTFSLERASVHISYDLIHSLEIRIQDELQIDNDAEATETSITGEAILYSGFHPNPGDVFYYQLPDEQIGVFVVNNVVPLSIHRGTHHRVNFHMYGYLSEDIDTKLRSSVIEELHFYKQTYFSGEATLLTDTSYTQLMKLMKFRKNAINYLMTHFYDKRERTIIVPGDIFDSYLVEMINQVVSVADTRTDICNLSSVFVDDFDYSIFGALISQDVTKLLYTGYCLNKYEQFVWDSVFSSIDKYRVIRLVDNAALESTIRTIPVKQGPQETEPKVASYWLSNRFYYALLRSFEDGQLIDDIVPLLAEMEEDPRVFNKLENEAYSVHTGSYHPLEFFEVHSKQTGSNNDLHLPELEYILLDYLLDNNLNLEYFVNEVVSQFPFSNLNDTDRLYWLVGLLHLSTVAIRRIR